jgi:hypothetical protein
MKNTQKILPTSHCHINFPTHHSISSISFRAQQKFDTLKHPPLFLIFTTIVHKVNKKPTSLLTLATVAGLTAALPQPIPSSSADQTYYYFRTSVKSNQPTAYNNYYLESWRTGAGLSDATFVQGLPDNGQVGWFNGTNLNWFHPRTVNGDGNYAVQFQVGGSNDAKWSPVCLIFNAVFVPEYETGTNIGAID